VVHKPAGLSVHESSYTGPQDATLISRLRAETGVQRLHAVHRLDHATSGAMLFALDAEAARVLSAQFETRTVEKTYLAVLRGHTEDAFLIDAPVEDARGRRLEALTRFATRGRLTLQPIQRRQHQQRQQRRRQDAADHHRRQRALHLGAGADVERHRHEAERATSAVISTGRRRRERALAIASSSRCPCSRRRRMKLIITTPLSTATPDSAMKPTPAEIDSGMSRSHSASTPPVSASGTPLKTTSASRVRTEGHHSSPKIISQRERHHDRRRWLAAMSCSKVPP
jgi:tRNA pseudouridine65 synthase